jgi:signal transduction histidine kinase
METSPPAPGNELLDALKERIKELTCLYRIADIANRPDLGLDEIMSHIVDLIPPSFQYPELASARLMIDGSTYQSANFQASRIKLWTEIVANYSPRGLIEVFYPDRAEAKPSFLREEQQLLKTISQQVALIIERKNMEEDNARLYEQLRHADRLATIGQLAAGIAHEINEPLGTILGFAQLVSSSGNLAPDTEADIRKIVNAALHAREVVRKLMLFSRQMPPRKEMVDLNRLIEDGFYFLENRCAKQGVAILRELEPGLPAIIADPSQLHQVLVNLTVNAMQAMPEGGTVTIRTRNAGADVEFTVSDTGIGMNPEVMQKIFVPFFTTKDIDQGTGLGLSVVHGIVTAHNGRIRVESKPRKGSVFTILFPKAPLEQA